MRSNGKGEATRRAGCQRREKRGGKARGPYRRLHASGSIGCPLFVSILCLCSCRRGIKCVVVAMCWASAAPRQPPLAKTSVVEVHTTPTYISEHTNASKAMKSTYGATVISDAQAFVAAAKARQDDGATKTSSLQALKILQDHDASALRSVLGKSSVGSKCFSGRLVLAYLEGAAPLALLALLVFPKKKGLSSKVDGRAAWTLRVPYKLLL